MLLHPSSHTSDALIWAAAMLNPAAIDSLLITFMCA